MHQLIGLNFFKKNKNWHWIHIFLIKNELVMNFYITLFFIILEKKIENHI